MARQIRDRRQASADWLVSQIARRGDDEWVSVVDSRGFDPEAECFLVHSYWLIVPGPIRLKKVSFLEASNLEA